MNSIYELIKLMGLVKWTINKRYMCVCLFWDIQSFQFKIHPSRRSPLTYSNKKRKTIFSDNWLPTWELDRLLSTILHGTNKLPTPVLLTNMYIITVLTFIRRIISQTPSFSNNKSSACKCLGNTRDRRRRIQDR